MKVVIIEPARFRLKHIYQYYNTVASIPVANKIRQAVIDKISSLKKFPLKGQIEENLKDLHQDHRYLVTGHIKIIYRIYKDIVYITDIFDTRQDPGKMGKL
jgi:toxin ParE1/3/4